MGQQETESQTSDPGFDNRAFYASDTCASAVYLTAAGQAVPDATLTDPTALTGRETTHVGASHLATLLLEAAARLGDLPANNFDAVITATLDQLAVHLAMEHVGLSLLQGSNGRLMVEQRYVAGRKVLPSAEELATPYPWYAAQLRQGKPVILPNGAEDLPPEAEAERAYALAIGLKCSLVIPLRIGEQLIGSLYFNSTTHAYTWPAPDLHALTIFARVLAGAAQRKRADEALRRNEEHLDLAIAAGVGIWSWDLEHPERSYGSENLAKIHGIFPCPKEQALQIYLAALHPADRAAMEQLAMRCVMGEVGDFAVEHELTWPDGSRHWIEARGYVVRDAAGHPQRLSGVMQEITQRKQAEAQIEQQRQELLRQARLMEQTEQLGQIGGWEWEIAANVCYCTPETYAIYGVSAATYVPQIESIVQFYVPASATVFKNALARARSYGESFDLKLQLVTAQDKTIWVRVTGRCELYNGQVTRLYGSIQDITLRTQIEEQLRDAQKMEAIGQLAGGIAHDFNNLLTAINTMSELALLYLDKAVPTKTTERVHHYIREIHRAGGRAAELTRQLLAFSRKQVLRPKVLDLRTVLLKAEEQLRAILGEKIDLLLALPAQLGVVLADPGQIEQALLNLTINARDAMPNGGTLTIRLLNVALDEAAAQRHLHLHPGNYVVIEVQDTGHGMTPEVQARLFDPFFTTKVIGEGSGLGLAMVFGIVKQSGGVIEVESQPAVGSTFRIFLPRSMPAARETLAPVAYVRGGIETVVVVEADGLTGQIYRAALEAKGYRVLEATHGRGAILLCQNFVGHIHLLVTNVELEDMSGVALANQALLFRPEMRALLLLENDKLRDGQEDALPSDYFTLVKPFSADILAGKVRSVLDAPAAMYLL